MDEHPMQASPAQEAPPPAGLFEDVVDAFVNPRALFARQRDPKFWGALIVFAILSGILLYAAGSAIAPVLQLEAMRALEGNPAIEPGTPPPAFMTNPAFQAGVALVVGPVFVLILGVFVWLIGKFFGFAGSVGHGLTPVAEVLQSLFIDVNTLTSRLQLSLGPVRFLDPETTSANLRGVVSRFDLTILWATVLIGIGLAVIGRMSAGRAAAAAATVWLLATAIAATGLGLG